MMPEVEMVTFEDIKHLTGKAIKEGVSATNPVGSEWYAIRVDGEFVAISSRLKIGGGAYRLRASWVAPEHRKKGFYSLIMKHLLDKCDYDCASVEVLVDDLEPFWANLGFRVVSRNPRGVARMTRAY